MPNVGRPREKRRKLMASINHLVHLHKALVYAPGVHWIPGCLGDVKRIQ